MRSSSALTDAHVRVLLTAYGLGSSGRLSDGPVGEGRVGSVWRLDTDEGSWAVKPMERDIPAEELREVADGAAFQAASRRAGVPTPAIRRTLAGDILGVVDGVRILVQSWVDLRAPDLALDPVAVGRLVAALHRVDFAGSTGRGPWYEAPVGRARWSELIRSLRARHAPFADELAALVPEIVALEALLGGEPRSLRTCHRDLWADNVRRTATGGLCVIDFDNAGLADAAQELALVLVEFAGERPTRAPAIRGAYEDAGGPGRVLAPTDFAMVIAQTGHIAEEGCRRWLAATTDADRADNEAWVRELIDRPLTQAMIEALLAAR
jgi:Ser/Thr protein kinase RdoA (MazF antagonist)